TSVCAVRLLTVAFTTNQTPTIGPRVNLKLPIIRLTGPSKTLSISSMLRDTPACKSSTNYVYDFGGKNLMLCFILLSGKERKFLNVNIHIIWRLFFPRYLGSIKV